MGDDDGDLQLPLKLGRVELRIAEADLRVWRQAALRQKQKLSEWIRCSCDERVARDKKVASEKR